MPRYESATTQAPAVNAQELTNSVQSEALGRATTMGTHTSSVNRPSCSAESVAASRAYTPMSTATPAAMSPLAHQATVAVGARKIRGTLNSSSQTKKEVSSTREATTAVRGQSRPTPDTREMKAQR